MTRHAGIHRREFRARRPTTNQSVNAADGDECERDTWRGVYLEGEGGCGEIIVVAGVPEGESRAVGVVSERGSVVRDGVGELAPEEGQRTGVR